MRTVSHHTATTYSRAIAYILSHDKGVCIWGRKEKNDLKLNMNFSYNIQCLLRSEKTPQNHFLTKTFQVH